MVESLRETKVGTRWHNKDRRDLLGSDVRHVPKHPRKRAKGKKRTRGSPGVSKIVGKTQSWVKS